MDRFAAFEEASPVGILAEGQIVFRQRMGRDEIAALLTKQQPCAVAMILSGPSVLAPS
jgi:hypothetical protein